LKQSGNKPGEKGKIIEFSKKSRREFIKFLCKIKDKLILWQDITFTDDVMQNKSERKKVSNDALNRFRRKVLDKYPSIKIVYKREWEPRKSGNLEGEYVPHFHMFMSVPDVNEDYELFGLASKLANIWVDCTGTKEIQKSLSVALHSKSYRIIKSQKQAMKYATKYITKPSGNWTDKSIGRSWRTIGKFDIPEPEIREMKPAEMVHVRRRLRKIAPKKHFIQKSLKQKEISTFLIVQENTVNRIIAHTQQQLENECRESSKAKGGQN
jgi:predicted XRE-type DNA-binding protein